MNRSVVPVWLPSSTAIFLAGFAVVITVLNLAKGFVDVDGFWHLATGRLILESGAVPTTDPFTFTWYGQPWTPHEWLSEVLMYLSVTTLGLGTTLLILGFVPLVVFGIQVAVLRGQGLRLAAIAAPAVLCGLVLLPYVTFRPQAMSWMLLSGLLMGLLVLRPERRRRSLVLIPLFVLWANFHGFYVVGLGVLAVYTVFTLAGRTPMAGARGWMVGVALAAVAATMLTPAGPIGLLYPLRYLEPGDWGLAHIPEWQSPDFHEVAHWPLLALIVVLGVGGRRAGPGWLAFLAWAGIAASLLSLRSAPVAAVMALPTLAYALEHRLARRLPRPERPGSASPLARRLIELGLAVAVSLAAIITALPRDLEQAAADDINRRFPVAATTSLGEQAPGARVYNAYLWGGWLIYNLTDEGVRNFVDGRNDMFSQQILEDYTAILQADPGWEALLATYGADAILVRPDARLIHGPAQLAGWCEVTRDEVAVLLLPACPD